MMSPAQDNAIPYRGIVVSLSHRATARSKTCGYKAIRSSQQRPQGIIPNTSEYMSVIVTEENVTKKAKAKPHF